MLSTIEQIRTALASAYPITLLVSPEEDRQEKLLRMFAASAKPKAVSYTHLTLPTILLV